MGCLARLFGPTRIGLTLVRWSRLCEATRGRSTLPFRPFETRNGVDMTVFTSPHPPLQIPELSLPDLVRVTAEQRSDSVAVTDAPSGRALTFGELVGGFDRVAAGLTARGFGPGGVLAILAPNLPEWPVAALGAMAAGGAVSGARRRATRRALAGSGAASSVRRRADGPRACAGRTRGRYVRIVWVRGGSWRRNSFRRRGRQEFVRMC